VLSQAGFLMHSCEGYDPSCRGPGKGSLRFSGSCTCEIWAFELSGKVGSDVMADVHVCAKP